MCVSLCVSMYLKKPVLGHIFRSQCKTFMQKLLNTNNTTHTYSYKLALISIEHCALELWIEIIYRTGIGPTHLFL